ncbi:MAG: peptidoglycan-binding domain-containing protein [Candidatus Thiodiazotropha sp.]
MSNGSTILAAAVSKIGQKYIFGAKVPLNDPNWPGPWDCAELTSWAVYQVSNVVYGCTDNTEPPNVADAWTGSWKRDANSIGINISWQEARYIPGAMLLRRSSVAGHIIISVGDGVSTVEARGEDYGVMKHVISGRRWDMGVLIPGIHYDRTLIEPRPAPTDAPPKVLFYSGVPIHDPLVLELQKKLQDLGFYDGPFTSEYGLQTAISVFEYQISKGLTPDGEFGAETAESIGIELSH